MSRPWSWSSRIMTIPFGRSATKEVMTLERPDCNWYRRRRFGQPAGGSTSRPCTPWWDNSKYKGSTAKQTELCRDCHCPQFTSKSMTSSRVQCSTIAQMPKANYQHIMWVWHCINAPASQGRWIPECSSTIAWWRLQCSYTPKCDIWCSETFHRGNSIYKDTLASVSNRSKFPGQFRFRFHPKPDRGNSSYHTKNPDHWKRTGFTTKIPASEVLNFGSN